MTEREIRKYIDRLNNGKAEESIFTRQISKTVDVAKVWAQQPIITKDIDRYHSSRFFFIKNEFNEYVGAILDMKSDLHWYVIPQHRKKGYLTRALKESILPFLFNDERVIQRITINEDDIGDKNYADSKSVAYNLGFKAIDVLESEFELKKADFNWDNENLKETNSEVSSERYLELRKRIYYAYMILSKISDELLMSVNDDRYLKELTDEVNDYIWKIEDIELENKKTKG